MGSEWLVGASGLFRGSPEGGWTQVGQISYPVNAILRRDENIIVGSEGGLWEVRGERWIQWHDETMTLVLGLTTSEDDLGVAVASAYGIATGALDENQVPRWLWYSDDLVVNERYSNVVITDPNHASRWLVGTEAGVLVCEGKKWVKTSLINRPVRGLCWAQGAFWAGADTGGIWRSEDGVEWEAVGQGLEDVPVYSLGWAGDCLIAGTEMGIAVGDGRGRWALTGPTIRVRAVNAVGSLWLAGANPGGLWYSESQGRTWKKTGDFKRVQAIVPMEEG